MNTSDAAKLLTVAAGFDRRQVTDITATAWAAALDGYTYPECERAIIDHHRDPETRGQYLTVGHVLDRVEADTRARKGDVEADVRSAKARGLIDESWPRREPLPADVAARLSFMRDQERLEARKFNELERGDDEDGDDAA